MASNVSQIFSMQKGSNQHIILNSHKTEISGNFLVLNDSSFSNVNISGTLKLNGRDISDRLGNFDTSLTELLTISNDASFNNLDISGIFKLNGIDISNRLGNFDTSLDELLTIGKDASFTHIDISGIFKLNGTDISNRLGNFDTSLDELLTIGKDASFTHVDISGIFKLNGRDISNRLGNFDTSLDELLTIGKDASFTHVDISGIFKLNGTDISNRLNNLLTIGNDASFNNLDISGTLKTDKIINKTHLNGISLENIFIKGRDITNVNAIHAQNYYLGNTNVISGSRQANFRDIEMKNSSNDVTFLAHGDTGNIDIYGTLKTDKIINKTHLNGISLEDIFIKSRDITNVNAIHAQNYYLGNTNVISGSRQANFRDIEMKNSSNDVTFLAYGDTGNIDMCGTLFVNTINEKTNGLGVTIDKIIIKDTDITNVNAIKGNQIMIIDPATLGDNTGTVQIKGNLEVLGNTTTINSNVLEISDNRILINSHSLIEGGIDISYSSDISYHFLHIYESNSWTTGDSSFITKNIQGNDATFTNVFINNMDVSAKLNVHDTKLTSFNTTLSNFDSSLNNLLTIGKDASFTHLDISGIFKLNGTDISNRLNNFDTSLTQLLTIGKDASFTHLDISGIFKLNGTDISNRLDNFDTSLNNLLKLGKDASFNNVDITGIFKLNGTDISNRLGKFDTSLNNLLKLGKDASFNNVDISGIFKLNGTDVSNRLGNFDTSLDDLDNKINNISTGSSDLSFNNIDISGTLTLSDVTNLGNMDISITNHILNIDAKNVSYLTKEFLANEGGDISDIFINNFLNNSQIIIYFKPYTTGNKIIGTNNSLSSNIKKNFTSDISFNSGDEGLITITKIANMPFCSASIFK